MFKNATLTGMIFIALMQFAKAETVPDCKSVFPDFNDASDLAKLPGTITNESFQEKIAQMDANFLSHGPTEQMVQQGLEYVKSAEAVKAVAGVRNDLLRVQNNQIAAERIIANVMDLREKGSIDIGSFTQLYCTGAKARVIAVYESQQDLYMIALYDHMVKLVQKYSH